MCDYLWNILKRVIRFSVNHFTYVTMIEKKSKYNKCLMLISVVSTSVCHGSANLFVTSFIRPANICFNKIENLPHCKYTFETSIKLWTWLSKSTKHHKMCIILWFPYVFGWSTMRHSNTVITYQPSLFRFRWHYNNLAKAYRTRTTALSCKSERT